MAAGLTAASTPPWGSFKCEVTAVAVAAFGHTARTPMVQRQWQDMPSFVCAATDVVSGVHVPGLLVSLMLGKAERAAFVSCDGAHYRRIPRVDQHCGVAYVPAAMGIPVAAGAAKAGRRSSAVATGTVLLAGETRVQSRALNAPRDGPLSTSRVCGELEDGDARGICATRDGTRVFVCDFGGCQIGALDLSAAELKREAKHSAHKGKNARFRRLIVPIAGDGPPTGYVAPTLDRPLTCAFDPYALHGPESSLWVSARAGVCRVDLPPNAATTPVADWAARTTLRAAVTMGSCDVMGLCVTPSGWLLALTGNALYAADPYGGESHVLADSFVSAFGVAVVADVCSAARLPAVAYVTDVQNRVLHRVTLPPELFVAPADAVTLTAAFTAAASGTGAGASGGFFAGVLPGVIWELVVGYAVRPDLRVPRGDAFRRLWCCC